MNKKAFEKFEISKSKLDQTKAGRSVVEIQRTQSGKNTTTGHIVQESIVIYDDGGWQHWYQDEYGNYTHGPIHY